MELTFRLRQDIIDLLEFVQAKRNAEEKPMADSTASKLCFGHGEYVTNLRKWDGGPGSPTLEKTLQFERFLLEQLDEKELEKFLKTRTRPTPASAQAETPIDDWE